MKFAKLAIHLTSDFHIFEIIILRVHFKLNNYLWAVSFACGMEVNYETYA